MKHPDWLAAHRVCELADPMRSNDAEAVAKSEMPRMRPVPSVQRRHGNLLSAESVASYCANPAVPAGMLAPVTQFFATSPGLIHNVPILRPLTILATLLMLVRPVPWS